MTWLLVHITCLSVSASSSCQPCPTGRLSNLWAITLLSPSPAPTPSLSQPASTDLEKGPRQISVSNPRWPPTFFNWRGELMCNQLSSGRVPSCHAHWRFSGERGWVWEKAGWGARAESQLCNDRCQERGNAVTGYTSHLIYSQYVFSSVLQTNIVDSLRHWTRIICQTPQRLPSDITWQIFIVKLIKTYF